MARGARRRPLPPGGSDEVDDESAESERLILGLRLDDGIAPGPSPAPGLTWGLETGLLETAGDRLRLTRRGRLLSNEVFARLAVAA